MAQVLESREDVFARLLAALPPSHEIAWIDDVATQARGVLSYIIERVGDPDESAATVPSNAATCPNCDVPTASTRSPYCGAPCRELAAFVRQFRTGLADGMIFDLERQEALGQNLWHLIGGGRPLRQHLIPDRSRAQVLARDGGKCKGCGAPATTIDHVATGCNRPINLQAVCDACCRAKSFGDSTLLSRPEVEKVLDGLAARIGSKLAMRCCDDAESWDWREYLARRGSL